MTGHSWVSLHILILFWAVCASVWSGSLRFPSATVFSIHAQELSELGPQTLDKAVFHTNPLLTVYGTCILNVKSTRRIRVCVEVLQPSQPIRDMSSVVSLPNHTFFLCRLSTLSSYNQYLCTFFHLKLTTALFDFVCVEVLRPSQPTRSCQA